MSECQGCGAWNDASRTLCVLCGTPLAATDEWDSAAEPPPLPPLPDGGLAASMPAWLREAPAAVGAAPQPAAKMDELAPLGPRADPRTFLRDDDFPRWLRDLAARETARPAAGAVAGPGPGSGSGPAWPSWGDAAAPASGVPAAAPASPVIEPGAGVAEAAADGRAPAAVVAARALEERRGRSPWETLLLVVLFIGVVVAAFWALVANGVFSPSL